MAPLFAACTHSLVALLEVAAAKKEIARLSLPNGEHFLVKLFEDDSLIFLKADTQILRRALEIVYLFAKALGSQCSIDKS